MTFTTFSCYFCCVLVIFLFSPGISDVEGNRLNVHSQRNQGYWTLVTKSSQFPVVRVGSREFHTLVTPSPKNYSVLTIFLDHYDCDLCYDAETSFVEVAHKYYRRHHEQKPINVFFVVVEYEKSQSVFQELGINPIYPSVFWFNELGEQLEMDKTLLLSYDSYRVIEWIESVENWANAKDAQDPVEPKNTDSDSTFFDLLFYLSIVIFCAQSGSMLWHHMSWDNAAVFLSVLPLVFTSGQMYNYIAKPALALKSKGTPGIIWIYPNTSSQTICESWLVFIIEAIMAYGFFKLIRGRSKELLSKRHPQLQLNNVKIRSGISTGLLFIMGGYMALTYTLAHKTNHY